MVECFAAGTSVRAQFGRCRRALLDQPTTLTDPPDRVRRWRAVVVLERLGTPEARHLLEPIAAGPPASIEADAAKAALWRLK